MKPKDKTWIVTDASTHQYGRKLSDWIFEFREFNKQDYSINTEDYEDEDIFIETVWDNDVFWNTGTIDLSEYCAKDVEQIINAYGYTLEPWSDGTFIFDLYKNKETVNWVIAECIFESEIY